MYSILYIFWCILPYIVNSEDRSDGNDKPRAGRDFQQHVHWYWIWWVAKCPWKIQWASAELEGGVYRMAAFTRQDRAGTLWSCRADDQAGNWEFVIDSLWVDPQTGHSPDPIEAQVVLRQTYTQLHLHLEKLESSGDFLASKIIMKDDGTYRIFGAFENRPCIAIQDKSRTHLGALVRWCSMWSVTLPCLASSGEATGPIEAREERCMVIEDELKTKASVMAETIRHFINNTMT